MSKSAMSSLIRHAETTTSDGDDLAGGADLLAFLSALSDPRRRRGIRHPIASLLAVAASAVLAGARSFTAIGEWAADASQEVLATLGIRRNVRLGRYVAPDEATLRRALRGVDPDEVDRLVAAFLAARQLQPAADDDTLRGGGVGRQDRAGCPGARRPAQPCPAPGQCGQPWRRDRARSGSSRREVQRDHRRAAVVGRSGPGPGGGHRGRHAHPDRAGRLAGHQQEGPLPVLRESQPAHPLRVGADGVGRSGYRLRQAQRPPDQPRAWPHRNPHHPRGHRQRYRLPPRRPDIPAAPRPRRSGRHTYQQGDRLRHHQPAQEPGRASPDQHLTRGHWTIENKLHYVRDLDWGEDQSQACTGNAPRVMASLRNLATGVLRQSGTANIAQALRHYARNYSRPLKLFGINPIPTGSNPSYDIARALPSDWPV